MKFVYPIATVRVTALLHKTRGGSAVQQVEFTARPRTVTLECNDYNTADTCTVTFDARHFPFLPRNVREILIQVYAGDGGGPFANDADIATDDNLRFLGYVDDPEMSLDEADGSITLKARDYTALFLDTKKPLTAVIPAYSDNLKTALRRIVDSIPGGENITLRLDTTTGIWPELRSAAPPGLLKAKIPTKPEDTAWHLIKRCCDPVSLIPRFELDTLIIAKSRGLHVPESRPIFIYGANVSSYMERRHLIRVVEGIGLHAYSVEDRGYIVALWPPVGDKRLKKKSKRPATKKAGKAKVVVEGVTGTKVDLNEKRAWFPYGTVANESALLDAAERIYIQRTFQEFSGQLKVKRIYVIRIDALDALDDSGFFDVTTLRNASRIMVDVDPKERQLLAELDTTDARVQFLVDDRDYNPSVAKTLVASYEAGLEGPIEVYVRKATHTYGETYECSIDFENLISGAVAGVT